MVVNVAGIADLLRDGLRLYEAVLADLEAGKVKVTAVFDVLDLMEIREHVSQLRAAVLACEKAIAENVAIKIVAGVEDEIRKLAEKSKIPPVEIGFKASPVVPALPVDAKKKVSELLGGK